MSNGGGILVGLGFCVGVSQRPAPRPWALAEVPRPPAGTRPAPLVGPVPGESPEPADRPEE